MPLIAFLGVPQSGKTTTSLSLAYHLKLMGLQSEYTPEYGRFHFIKYGFHHQAAIQMEEYSRHYTFKTNSDQHTVCDSAVPNNFLYTDVRVIKEDELSTMYDYLFYCHLLPNPFEGTDNGRVHTYQQSVDLDSRLKEIISEYDLNVIDLPPMSVEKRLDLIMNHLNLSSDLSAAA